MDLFRTTRRNFTKLLLGSAAVGIPAFSADGPAQSSMSREVLNLDGEWQIEDSVEADAIPSTFGHTVPVPGLAHLASPPFANVDEYQTREYILTAIGLGLLPPSADTGALGRTVQKRNYFWYRTTFRPSTKRQIAILRINKAQFGTAVWLNGKKIGEHLSCFTRGNFNITQAMQWDGENDLLVRIGAHPGVLPTWVPAGSDQEKPLWTPGIYDSVSVQLCDNPMIESVQVAPRIGSSSIIVQTQLRNYESDLQVSLQQRISTWKEGKPAAKTHVETVSLKSGESKVITQEIHIPEATLWTPEEPFLYVVETRTHGDGISTRFGMREFRFDTVSRRAMLNGRPYFLRGSNITLHRFFGDPLSKRLPWTETWVRKLLGEIPKQMHWNCVRICIGPAPEMWLNIADEVGLLFQYEYAIWTGVNPWRHELWKTSELLDEFTEFVQDNWNHPSVAIWDASNETRCDVLREEVIPKVRMLDLSNRPWDNGYNVPQGPNDGYEDHPYIFSFSQPPYYNMHGLDNMEGPPLLNAAASGHAAILNEYDDLFLRRNGTPTVISKKFFDALLGPGASTDQRFELRAYYLGGLTEFWRAFRFYAGVLYFPYLDSDLPNTITCDTFYDVEKLTFQPHFEEYMEEAFKPLGVYIHSWKPTLQAGKVERLSVMLANDESETAKGELVLAFTSDGGQGAEANRAAVEFEVPPLGQMTYILHIQVPNPPGDYLLWARATWPARIWSPTVSRRKITVVAATS